MGKLLISCVLLGAFLVVAFYALNGFIYNEKQDNSSLQANNKSIISQESEADFKLTPISHATMFLEWGENAILTDPVGSTDIYIGRPTPDLILLTDIHRDHLDSDTLRAVTKSETVIVAPKAVVDLLPQSLLGKVVTLGNGETVVEKGFKVEAVPMYNVPESDTSAHVRGRGNGYVVEYKDKRIYISGDSGNTPEMRALQNIDTAFVAMNLPYTMNIEDATQAVLAFKPVRVIPYHFKGQDGFSDTLKFRELVHAGNNNIEVDLIDFYPND